MTRNIHFARFATAEPAEDEPEAEPSLGRLRAVTNSPQREYSARPGAVEALPDSVAALILCKVGQARVERHQIKITLDGEELFFTSRDSIVIAAKNGMGARVLWALNRRAPDVLHLLEDDGSYIESLPRKGEATWFSRDEASQEAMATTKAHLNRDMQRLQDLHALDSAAAARDASDNAAQVARLVQTFPAASVAREERPACGENSPHFARAEQFAGVVERCEEQRTRRGQAAAVDLVADTLSRPVRVAEEAADAWA